MKPIVLLLPFPKRLAFAVWPFIFLPPRIYRAYRSGVMSVADQGVLLHEQTHFVRQYAVGLMSFGWQYFFNKRYRLAEELAAIEEQMKHLKQHGEMYDVERMARFFASPVYGYVLSYDESIRTLTHLWMNI